MYNIVIKFMDGDCCMEAVYTVSEVARILRVSPRTVYKIIQAGELQAIRVRGQYRITADALQIYLQGVKKDE